MKKVYLKFKTRWPFPIAFLIGLSTILLIIVVGFISLFKKVLSLSYQTDHSNSSVSEQFQIKNLSSFVLNSNLTLFFLGVLFGILFLVLFFTRHSWEKYLSEKISNHPHPRVKGIKFHKYLHWVMLGLTILILGAAFSLDFQQKTKISSAATFTKNWTSYNDFYYATGSAGPTSTTSSVTINGSGTPTDANSGTVTLASTSSATTQTSDTDFDAGTFSDTAVSGSGNDAGVVAKSSSWWDINYNYQKQLTVTNSTAAATLSSGTTVSLNVNTKDLVDNSKLQADCDDLRIVRYSDSTFTELTRSLTYASGATGCSDSNSTTVSFPTQADISANGSDSTYYLYYGYSSAATPTNTLAAYNVGTASATFVAPFNGTTSAIASGSGTPTTQTGAIRFSGQKSALLFNGVDGGTSGRVKANYSSNLYTNTALTVEFWFKSNLTTPGFDGTLLSKGGSTTTNYTISTGYAGGGVNGYIARFLVGGNFIRAQSNTIIADGNWHHISGVWDGSTAKIYVDGVEGNTSNSGITMNADNGNGVGVGASSEGYGGRRNVFIDEVRISNAVRYNTNFTPPTTPFTRDANTMLLMHFDENGSDPRNSSTAIDDSGNGNHGAFTGSPLPVYVGGLVGIDASSSDAGTVSAQPYASHNGVFLEEATTNKTTNPSFENATYDLNWTADASISASSNTTAPYFKFGTRSAKLIDSTAAANFTTSVNVGNTNNHTLSAYVYRGTTSNIANTVNSSVAKLIFNGSTVTPAYTDVGGGWWRLSTSSAGIASAQNFGVEVQANETIYLDGMQLEEVSYNTTYADGSLGTDYSWTGAANNSTSTRTAASLRYSDTSNISTSSGTVNFWLRPDWDGGVDFGSSWTMRGYFSTCNWSGGDGFRIFTGSDASGISYNRISADSCLSGGGGNYVNTTISKGKWYHVVFTWDGTNGTLYINNVSNTYAFNFSSLPDGIRVGGDTQTVATDGVISDLRIWDKALTAAQVADLYRSGLTSHSEASESNAKYSSSGDFTSSVIDLGQNSNFGNLDFTASAPAGTTLQYQVRASSSASMTGASWYGPTGGGDYYTSTGTDINSTLDGNRYVQYKAFYTTSDQTTTATLSDITVNNSYYPANYQGGTSWYNVGWGYRGKITLDHTQATGGADLTNFPVLISSTNSAWKDTSNGGHVGQSDGGDILFTSSDGTTKLSHEIEKYDPATGEIAAWVKIPTLSVSTDTEIYLYYGNATVSDQEDTADGVNDVWDDNYVGVWHLNNTNYNNSTSIANLNGTAYNSPGNLTTAKIAGGVSFSASTDDNDYIEIANNANLNSANSLTVEAWVKVNQFTNDLGIVSYVSPMVTTGYALGYSVVPDFRSYVTNGVAFGHTQAAGGTPSVNTWYHVVGVYDGANLTTYVNGTAGTPAAYNGGIAANTTRPLRFGVRADDDPGNLNDLNGDLDEVKISNSVRSAAWIATSFNNQNSPSTFYSIASEEAIGGISNLILDTTTESSWGSINWNASTTSATDVKFRVRSASLSADLSAASWSDYLTNSGASLTSIADNQFLELETNLVSTDTSQTPTLNDVSVTYVQNAPPVVATPSASLATDGTGIVTLTYQLTDTEDGLCTDSGVCAGVDNGSVTATIQYSTDSATWSNASTVSQTGMSVSSGVITLTNVHQAEYSPQTTYTTTWNAETDLGTSIDSETYYLRVRADDGNAVKNITNSGATTLTIDTQSPTSPSISITATPSVTVEGVDRTSSTSVTLNLSATDNDNTKYMMIKTNDNTFSEGTWESYAATKSAYALTTTSSNLTNIIYVKFKDSFGNESTTASDSIVYDSSSPATPENLKISDFSDTPNEDYRLLLSWSRVANPTSNDFASYQVYRSTDSNSDGTLLTTINSRTTSYYVDQGLTKDQRYYYKVKSVDSLGNTSDLSSAISAAPSVGDIASPALAADTTVEITTTSTTATFTFYTADVSTGYVDYGTNNTLTKTVGEVEAVSSQNPHSITLTNLSSGTTYTYRVRATSVTNFEGKTKTSTLEEDQTFTTSSNVTISNVTTTNISTSSAWIRWNTSETSAGTVSYGTTTALGSTQEEALSGDVVSNTHTVPLTGLTPGTTYYYRVQSGNSTYPESSSSPSSFTTASVTEVSTTPPVIAGTGPSVTALSTSVTITWTTDKISDSFVEFGLTSSYGTLTGLDNSTLSHSVTLTGLTPSTTYHFRVKSKDADGNTGVSSDATFTTKDKSVITEVTISDITLNSAILSWTTNVISSSKVKIGTKINSYDQEISEESTDKTLNHVARIKDLKEGTKYFLRIVGTDGDGNNLTSDDYPFSTISLPKISEIKVKSLDAHATTITWVTNVLSDSTVSYGTDRNSLGTDKGKSDLVTNHEIKLTNLADNTKYFFKVKSRDNLGNLSEGEVKDFTTATDTTAPAISEIKSESSLVGSGETGRIQIIVSWSTDEPATSQIDYDEGVGLGTSTYTNHTTQDKTLNQSHIVIISGLKPSTTYHFRVVSKDSVGNESKSTEYTVLTPPKDVSTLQLILKSWEETFSWVNNLKKVLPFWPF